MRISDWSSDVCSSDLHRQTVLRHIGQRNGRLPIEGKAPAPDRFGVRPRQRKSLHRDQHIFVDALPAPIGLWKHAETVKKPPAFEQAKGIAIPQRDRPGASQAAHQLRTEERRDGKEGVSTFRSRWSTYHNNKK